MLPSYPWWGLGGGLLALLAIVVLAGGIGSVYVPPMSVLQIVAAKLGLIRMPDTVPWAWQTIIWEIRLPRIALAAIVGAGLALSGATYQGLFRNPLADPYLIGVASGAGLGATVVLLTGIPAFYSGFSLLPIAAFLGGLLAVSISYLIARRSGGLPLTTLILAGVAIGSLTSAVTSLLMIRANPDVKPLLGWLLGGLAGADWKDVQIVLPYVVLGIIGMMAYARVLNLFQLDEEEARQLGVSVERTKLILIVLASLTTAAAVSMSGLIGFVGLVAPHAVRLVWGHDHRFLLPMAMLVGAAFLVLADLVARTIVSPSELPVGVVTAFCGAPFFLYLLQRGRRLA
ncbi:MAG: iron ABC transporter permease [Chloroflexi bacterium]|nr:iron ABC transporter permease [Chloroflexota bacterium]